MELLVLNGNPDPANHIWEQYLADWSAALRDRDVRTEVVHLREMDIRYCNGCWSCWWATPGRCSRQDDLPSLYPRILRADVLVWASPLVMGNVSALTKKAQDRFIPLLHPFIEMVGGESHHRRRYDKDINMALIAAPGAGDDAEDLDIVRQQHERLALNGRGRLLFFLSTTTAPSVGADQAVKACLNPGQPSTQKEEHRESISA